MRFFSFQQSLSLLPPPGGAGALLLLAAPPALAQTGTGLSTLQVALIAIIVVLLFGKTLLLLGLLRSRARHERAETDLKLSQQALEKRVVDRTQKLRSINNQLYEEIARHEITEERLEETQNYLQSIINSMPSVLIGLTREGSITHWNSAAERATEIPAADAISNNINEISPDLELDMDMVRDAIDQGVSQVKEGIRHEFAGQVAYTDLIIYPLLSEDMEGAVVRIDDVTMRVRFENMMIQNEKMMSLGELAAGMAHEINNPLSAILHAVQNVYRRTSPDLPANRKKAEEMGIELETLQEYMEARGIYNFIDSIKDAGERSARIVTNMLEFSRASSRRHDKVDITQLLEHSLELSRNSLDLRTGRDTQTVQVVCEFGEDLPQVPCSAAEIQQVILNMLRNAAQAFEQAPDDGVEPTIVLRVFREGDLVRIQVADNGPGMPEATRRHIFEPFFTTKDVGKGTGLGLSVSYFIITEHHDGQIEVDSAEGSGTTFTISLPLEEQADATTPAASSRSA